MRKRVFAFLLVAVSLITLVGCKKTKKLIENEADAKEVIECPKENMFGLEKIALFEDRAVAVFDEKLCEGFEYDENDLDTFSLKGYLDEEEPGFHLTVENMVNIWPEEDKSSIELKDGHYIVTIIFPNKESYKEDPDEDFEILGLHISGMTIWITEETVELRYTARGYDIMWYYTQEFDRAKGKWEKVDEDEVSCMTTEID
ncbi:MAG: hypothetical protein IKR22_01315 [Clostridiales bacterium]|nr:hypothetical protein [Clostridiales bacterium]